MVHKKSQLTIGYEELICCKLEDEFVMERQRRKTQNTHKIKLLFINLSHITSTEFWIVSLPVSWLSHITMAQPQVYEDYTY